MEKSIEEPILKSGEVPEEEDGETKEIIGAEGEDAETDLYTPPRFVLSLISGNIELQSSDMKYK